MAILTIYGSGAARLTTSIEEVDTVIKGYFVNKEIQTTALGLGNLYWIS